MIRVVLTCLSLLIISASAARAQESAPTTTAIRAGALVDPATGSTTANQIILVRGNRIVDVGGDLSIPSGARIIDLSDRAVLPGMLDAHVHTCAGMKFSVHNGNIALSNIRDSTAYRAIAGTVRAREMLEAGFTTIRDIGNAGNYADFAVRRALREGLVPGPTMLAAGKIISPFGGQSSLPHEHPWIDQPEYLYADTRDEMTKAIRENIHFGADFIKIVMDDQPYIYSVEDVKFIVAEAANCGVTVAAHSVTDRGARALIEGGVHSIEHGWNMSDGALRMAKEKGVWLVTTELSVEALMQYNIPREVAEALHASVVDRMRRAHAIGTPIAFGSDLIMDFPDKTRGEASIGLIDSFVESGLPPKAILEIMIPNPAKLLGMGHERGKIAPGYYADVIATGANPVEDITALKRVSFVMKNGVVIRQ